VTSKHVCGLAGYNPMIDPPCGGCGGDQKRQCPTVLHVWHDWDKIPKRADRGPGEKYIRVCGKLLGHRFDKVVFHEYTWMCWSMSGNERIAFHRWYHEVLLTKLAPGAKIEVQLWD
jgi:hypothetical protein